MVKTVFTVLVLLSSPSYAEVSVISAGPLGGLTFCAQSETEINGLSKALETKKAVEDKLKTLPPDADLAKSLTKALDRLEQSIKHWRDGLNSNPAAVVLINLDSSMKISKDRLFISELGIPTAEIAPINSESDSDISVGPGQLQIQFYRSGLCPQLKEAGGDFNSAAVKATTSLFLQAN